MQHARKPDKKRRLLTALATVIIVFIAGILIAYAQYINFFEYLEMRQKCGTNELVTGRTYPKDSQPRYKLPTDPNYRAPAAFSHYFCTEQDAIDAGYIPLYDEDGFYNQD